MKTNPSPLRACVLRCLLATALCAATSLRAQQSTPAAPPPDAPATITVLTGARLIDGTGRPPVDQSYLVIEHGRIVAVGKMDGDFKAPAGATVIDVRGRTIIPGLISAHSHLGLTKGASAAAPENYTRENVAQQLDRYERLRRHGGDVARRQPRPPLHMARRAATGKTAAARTFSRRTAASVFPAVFRHSRCPRNRFIVRKTPRKPAPPCARRPDATRTSSNSGSTICSARCRRWNPPSSTPPSTRRTLPPTRRTATTCGSPRTCFTSTMPRRSSARGWISSLTACVTNPWTPNSSTP